jgi:hypothetical protein
MWLPPCFIRLKFAQFKDHCDNFGLGQREVFQWADFNVRKQTGYFPSTHMTEFLLTLIPVYKSSPYRAVNTFHLGYKNQ